MTTVTTSEFIAGLIGPAFLAIAISILTNRAALNAMIGQIADNYAVVFLAGLLLLLAGLAIVRVHPDWGEGWTSLITAIGWLSVLGGLVRMMIPDQSAALARQFVDNRTAVTTGGVILLVLGAYMTAKGYGFA